MKLSHKAQNDCYLITSVGKILFNDILMVNSHLLMIQAVKT